jgi:dihydroflavonol-4-reductase
VSTRPNLALVTGATGFVGAAVARNLQSAGYNLRIMHRASADLRNLNALTGERVIADLTRPKTLARALDGCDALFHVAADYRLWARRPQELFATNVDGTLALLRAATEAGVKRCVYTSSVSTLPVSEHGHIADERGVTKLDDMLGAYKRSKFQAERSVLEFVKTNPIEVVIVNPSTPLGPGDVRPTPTGRIVREAAAGRIPAFVDTGLNIAHVDDVADGHRLAYERGVSGERYILGGTNMTLADILAHVCTAAGRSVPTLRLPRRLIFPIAYATEAWCHLIGRKDEPLLTVDGLRMARYQMFFSSARAEQELGYVSRSSVLALDDALRWFQTNPDI